MQRTLGSAFELEGTTLHRGISTRIRVSPAPAGHGRVFIRTDLPGESALRASAEHTRPTALSTSLVFESVVVQTPEHLLAALYGLGIDNCCIELDGPELPILDGSAKCYVEAITGVGIVEQDQPRRQLTVQALTVHERDAFVTAVPSSEPGLRVSYGIDFPEPIGQQWCSLKVDPESFAREIAPARTFTLLAQIEQLKARGLIQGGSLDCALVAGPQGWLTPPTWSDEPVRHKILDLLGDLSLAELTLEGHIVAYKAGHTLHGELARRLMADYRDRSGSVAPAFVLSP